MSVSRSENRCKWNTVSISDQMVFTTGFASIGGIRARFFPPQTERMEALSTTALDQSILSTSRNLANNTSWTFCHTPAFCQSSNLLQQVMPEPHPISWGRSSQAMPVLRTKRIPVKTLLLSKDFRPGYRNCLCFGSGRKGSITFHSSSLSNGFAMCLPPFLKELHMAYRYSSMNVKLNSSFC